MPFGSSWSGSRCLYLNPRLPVHYSRNGISGAEWLLKYEGEASRWEQGSVSWASWCYGLLLVATSRPLKCRLIYEISCGPKHAALAFTPSTFGRQRTMSLNQGIENAKYRRACVHRTYLRDIQFGLFSLALFESPRAAGRTSSSHISVHKIRAICNHRLIFADPNGPI